MTQATPRNLRPTPRNPICQLAMEAGPCYALKPRFFFNFQSRRCEEFIYGGCRGNENNFQTMQVSPYQNIRKGWIRSWKSVLMRIAA